MALSLALAMGLSLCACGDEKKDDTTTATEGTTATEATEATDDTASDADATGSDSSSDVPLTMPAENGETIYVYSWNEELGGRLQYFKDAYPQYADLVQYENLGLGGTSDEYKSAIENAIQNGGEKVPSIIACDNDVALYFLNSEAIVPVEDIGITTDMYKNAYQYTVDYATIDGKLKGLTWQATPGGFVYRTDIADKVLGVTEPDDVQEYVKDWDTFFETADKMKAEGYSMLSGCDDVKYVFMDQRTSPWVENDTVTVDQAVVDYLETAKKLYDGEYTTKSTMWDDNWNANFTGDVFGYFGCTWFTYWCIKDTEVSDTYGQRRMCAGPADYHWGGTYLGVTAQCPNKELAALVIYTLCCDTDVMYKLSEETLDFVNNTEAVEKLIADGKGASPVLGGQNPLATWNEAAKNINLKNATEYDSTFNTYMDNASASYNSGEFKTVDEAVASIKEQIRNAYQYLTVE